MFSATFYLFFQFLFCHSCLPLSVHINRLSGLPTLEHATYNGPWENNPYSDLYLMILMIALELC